MVDDATAVYIHEVHSHFEDLKQVASQLAGLLVLSAAGAKSAGPDHPLLRSAGEVLRNGAEGVRSARVPERARSHHDRLASAATLLQRALTAARAGLEVDPVLIPLRAAYSQLQQAAAALPGFEIISFDQACCARAAQ
jgi:hypothetical protein